MQTMDICSLFLVGSSCSIWLTSSAIIIPRNALYVLSLLTFQLFYMAKSEALTSDFVYSLKGQSFPLSLLYRMFHPLL